MHKRTLVGLACLTALGLLLGIRFVGSAVQENVGMVILSRELLMPTSASLSGDLDNAERWLRRALAWDDANTGAHRGLAWVLKMRGQEAEATAEWRDAGITAQYLVSQSGSALRAKRYIDALLWSDILAVIEPGLRSTVFYLRYMALRAGGDAGSAGASLQEAIAIDRGWLRAEMRFRAWHLWGVAL